MRELSLNVMDVAQNSIAAGATLTTITLREDTAAGTAEITIADNGCGMTPEQGEKVQSPFYTTRTTRPVGLGVPLFKMASEMTGGAFSITSAVGEGTVVKAAFHTGHIDMTPIGDMNETILLLVISNPDIDFAYQRERNGKSFTLDTRELREVLGDEVPLSSPDVAAWIRENLREEENGLLE